MDVRPSDGPRSCSRGGGNPPPAPPAPAFSMDAFFTRFEQILDAKLKPAAPPAPPAPAPPAPPAPGNPPDPKPVPTPQPVPDPRLAKLENDLAEEKKRREETEKR